MIHISKTKSGKFIVVTLGNNGELLSSSEPLESKQSAWKNIRAQMKCFRTGVALVQDDALVIPIVYSYRTMFPGKSSKHVPGLAPHKIYIPGKNKKKVLAPKVR